MFSLQQPQYFSLSNLYSPPTDTQLFKVHNCNIQSTYPYTLSSSFTTHKLTPKDRIQFISKNWQGYDITFFNDKTQKLKFIGRFTHLRTAEYVLSLKCSGYSTKKIKNILYDNSVACDKTDHFFLDSVNDNQLKRQKSLQTN
tara:strand:+ start:83 stop:508 length:426 start_codon:yes stop_codon:yes gene_type:complete